MSKIHEFLEFKQIAKSLNSQNFYWRIIFIIHLLSILIKVLIGNYGFSGQNTPPKHGDFEAQRHWMEITNNIPIYNWYTDTEDNTNPKSYWPLDYPPMSAYFAYIWGLIFKILIPESILIITSRGIETFKVIKLMRISVLISDILIFHTSLQYLLNTIYEYKIKDKKILTYNRVKIIITLCFVLLNPTILLIDHGHFQYNSVMLGLFLFSVAFLIRKFFSLSIIFILLSINFKQMAAYYAFPYVFYCLRHTFKSNSIIKSFLYFIFYIFVFIATLLVIWSPWILTNTHNDVLKRIFPLWRGIFEDKVATFWCNLNIFLKINKFSQSSLIYSSIILTLSFSLPSACLLKTKARSCLFLCLFLTSMSFFMFSFHVHEKTIILPSIVLLFSYEELSSFLPSYNLLSTFSLFPLLKRENQEIPYLIMMFFYFFMTKVLKKTVYLVKIGICEEKEIKHKESTCLFDSLLNVIDYINLFLVILYHFLEIYITPPEKFPYLFPLINAFYCFIWFFFTYIGSFFELIRKLLNKNE